MVYQWKVWKVGAACCEDKVNCVMPAKICNSVLDQPYILGSSTKECLRVVYDKECRERAKCGKNGSESMTALNSKSNAKAADEGLVGHHGGIDAVVRDEAATESKAVYNALIVHDGLRDARFPDTAWADERDVFAAQELKDSLLHDHISSKEDSRFRRDVISGVGRVLCGESIVQE